MGLRLRRRTASSAAYPTTGSESIQPTAAPPETYHVIKVSRRGSLNMREGPAQTYPVVKTLGPGTRGILLLSGRVPNGSTWWQEISFGGHTGWVNEVYLEADFPPVARLKSARISRRMVRHADSLLLVWKLAELEAQHLDHTEIQPEHFLLGLLKIVDIDVIKLVEVWQEEGRESVEQISSDISAVRSVFGDSSVDTTILRRRLRRRLGRGMKQASSRLRRSDRCSRAFSKSRSNKRWDCSTAGLTGGHP